MSRLPGREALEVELETAKRPVPPSAPDPEIGHWDRRVRKEHAPPKAGPPKAGSLRDRLRALFDRR